MDAHGERALRRGPLGRLWLDLRTRAGRSHRARAGADRARHTHGHVYLVYHSQQKIWASVSDDEGETWTVSQPVHITNSTFGVSLPSGAAIDMNGVAYFAWNGANRPGQAQGTKTLYGGEGHSYIGPGNVWYSSEQ